MKKERIVTRRWGDRRKGKTDWARFDAMTDAQVEASIANDPDWAEFKDIDWSDAVLVIPTRKKAISIRVDEDVLDYSRAKAMATSAASMPCCVPTCSRKTNRKSVPDAAIRYRS